MRHGRAKAARKTLQYFKRVTGLTAPYRVLLDATIVASLFQAHIVPVRERVDKVLQTFGTGSNNYNTYCITKSAVEELEMIHASLQEKQHPKADAFAQALEWIHHECRVLEVQVKPLPATTTTTTTGVEDNDEKEKDVEEDDDDDDAKKNSDNHNSPGKKKKSKQSSKNRHGEYYDDATNNKWTPAQKDFIHCIMEQGNRPYVVGSQDEMLLDKLRNMGIVPIIRLANQSVLLLEHPSKQSQSQAKGEERRKWKHNLADSEKALVSWVRKEKKKTLQIEQQQQQQQRRPTERVKAKAKGPNPLSCKRKQQQQQQQSGGNKESASSKRRKRAKKQKQED